MKQDIIKKATENLHAKKRKALADFDEKMSPLYKDQDYIETYKRYTQTLIQNTKNEIFGEKTDKKLENYLKNQLFEIKKKYNVENEAPHYSCQICEDEGYANGQMCKCLKKEISTILLNDSGFEKLESFKESITTSGEFAPYYQKMKEWCNSDFKKNLIYITGPTGVGKTYLIRSMANELLERGKVIKIVTAFKMNQDFKDFSKYYDEEILNKYLDCEILFIDDLGTEPLYKNVTLEYLYLIINERKMKKLPVVITSNLDLYDIRDRYDERIFSRIVDRQTSITICLNGEDKRLKK